MNRFGLSHSSDDKTGPHADAGPAVAPHAGDTLFEIGVIIVLHLAFAVAVLATLDAFGVR